MKNRKLCSPHICWPSRILTFQQLQENQQETLLKGLPNGYKRFLLPNTSYGLENYESKPKKESNKGLEM